MAKIKVKVPANSPDLSPQKPPEEKTEVVDLRPRPLGPNINPKNRQVLKTDPSNRAEIHFKPDGALRSKQQATIRRLMEESRTKLYLDTRAGTITERQQARSIIILNRIERELIKTMPEWAGDIQPRVNYGDGVSREFRLAWQTAFNKFRDAESEQAVNAPVPTEVVVSSDPVQPGPITSHQVEVPEELKLSDLVPVVQALDSGPLHEQSVLEGGLQQPDLPVFDEIETEEDSGIHPVRSDEVSPPEGGDDPVRDIE